MTDMDIVEAAYEQAAKNNVKFSDVMLSGRFAGTGYNPFVENKVVMILYGQNVRI